MNFLRQNYKIPEIFNLSLLRTSFVMDVSTMTDVFHASR